MPTSQVCVRSVARWALLLFDSHVHCPGSLFANFVQYRFHWNITGICECLSSFRGPPLSGDGDNDQLLLSDGLDGIHQLPDLLVRDGRGIDYRCEESEGVSVESVRSRYQPRTVDSVPNIELILAIVLEPANDLVEGRFGWMLPRST